MGSATSSNYSSQAQSAVASMGTSIAQQTGGSSYGSNTITQLCDGLTIDNTKNGCAKVCNMQNVLQANSVANLQTTMQKAAITNTSSQSLKQGLKSAAKSILKGFNMGQYSNAQNVARQSMSASSKINNAISQKCVQNNTAVNNILQSCQNAVIKASQEVREAGCGVMACNLTNVRQQNLMKQIQKCSQDTKVTNKIVQDLEQKAKQVAIAEAHGIDLLGWLGTAALIVGILLCVGFATTVYGVNSFVENARKISVGAILMVIGFILIVTGSIVGATQTERWVKTGVMRPQMFASANVDGDIFADDNPLFCNSASDTHNCCNKPKDGTVKAPTYDDIKNWCRENSTSTSTTYKNYCNGTEPRHTIPLVGIPYRQLTDVTIDSANTVCAKDPKCMGWRWRQSSGTLGDVYSAMKQEPQGLTGFFQNAFDGSDAMRCDRKKCLALGMNSEECAKCCPSQTACAGNTPCDPLLYDPCSRLETQKECDESTVYQIWDDRDKTIGGCSVKCRWGKGFDENGNEKTKGADKCQRYKCNTENKRNSTSDHSDEWSSRACFDVRCARFGCQYCDDSEQARGNANLLTRKDFTHTKNEKKLFHDEKFTWSEYGNSTYPYFVSKSDLIRSVQCWADNQEYAAVKFPAPIYDVPFLITVITGGLGALLFSVGLGFKIKGVDVATVE